MTSLYKRLLLIIKNVDRKWYLITIGSLLVLVIMLIIVIIETSNEASSQITPDKKLSGNVVFPNSDYSVKWDSESKMMEILHKGSEIETFSISDRPLAVWLKPETKTAVIVASEDMSVSGNHTLYAYKKGKLTKLYHLVSKRHFYNIDSSSELPIDDVIVTPNEELVVTREYDDIGFYPRVFFIDSTHLSFYRNTWDLKNLYWSPNGKCYLYWGEERSTSTGPTDWQDDFGYFVRSDDFVSYDLIGATSDRRNIDIRWVQGNECEGYLSQIANSYGGHGTPDVIDKQFSYHFGESVSGKMEEINLLPQDFSSLPSSIKTDQELIMVTNQ